jgi:hypothetical protein
MVGHDDITINIMALLFKIIKPVVNELIPIYNFNKWYVIVTNNGYEKGSFCKGYVLSSGHELKDLNKNKKNTHEDFLVNLMFIKIMQRPLRVTLLRKKSLFTSLLTENVIEGLF